MKTKWIAAAAAGTLGIGMIAAGAVSVANAVEIRDAQGSIIASEQIRGDVVHGGAVSITTTGEHASVASPGSVPSVDSGPSGSSAPSGPSAPSAPSGPSAPSASAAPAASAQQPAQAPAPVALPSATSVGSGDSAGSAG